MDTTPPPAQQHPACPVPARDVRQPWTLQDVCGWLQVTENTLRKLIDTAGFPPPTLLGGLRIQRWSFADVDRWWQAQLGAGTPAGPPVGVPAGGAGGVPAPDAAHPYGVVDRNRRSASR